MRNSGQVRRFAAICQPPLAIVDFLVLCKCKEPPFPRSARYEKIRLPLSVLRYLISRSGSALPLRVLRDSSAAGG